MTRIILGQRLPILSFRSPSLYKVSAGLLKELQETTKATLTEARPTDNLATPGKKTALPDTPHG